MKNSFSKIFNSGESKLVSLLKFGSFIFTWPGLNLMVSKLTKQSRPLVYNKWIKAQIRRASKTAQTADQKQEIKISVIISVYRPNTDKLIAAINSVIAQTSQNWELIVEDAYPDPKIIDIARNDKRIKLVYRTENYPIPPCSNTILTTATGSYLLFMAQDDMLTANCIAALCNHISKHPADDLIYADEDTTDDNNHFSHPYFKPGWSPDSLLSRNYIGHNIAIKRTLLERVDGIHDGYKCGSYYELILRLTEMTGNIGHIPLVLSHGRTHDLSEKENQIAKDAIGDALKRREISATVQNIEGVSGCYHINYETGKREKVSIIIPTKDNTALLKKTIDSILRLTDYPDYEVIVLNNNSKSDEFFALMDEYKKQQADRFQCIDANFPFNFAKLMNMGAQQSAGTYLLLLNNDVEVLHADWMTEMVSYAQRKHTGAVGVKLLYPDNTIQHAGIVLGGNDGAGHVHANTDRNDHGYFRSLKAATNYTAVTAACLMCRKDVFTEVGGMDESLAVEYNDIDLCLKMLSKGYYNIYLPSVELYHYESATRGHPFRSRASWKQHDRELAIFKGKWQILIDNDPFYNAYRRLIFR